MAARDEFGEDAVADHSGSAVEDVPWGLLRTFRKIRDWEGAVAAAIWAVLINDACCLAGWALILSSPRRARQDGPDRRADILPSPHEAVLPDPSLRWL